MFLHFFNQNKDFLILHYLLTEINGQSDINDYVKYIEGISSNIFCKRRLIKFNLNLAFQYFNIAEIILNSTINNKNIYLITSDENIAWSDLIEKTKFSDYNIIIPILFNFYHAIELIIKELIYLKNRQMPKKRTLFLVYYKK